MRNFVFNLCLRYGIFDMYYVRLAVDRDSGIFLADSSFYRV